MSESVRLRLGFDNQVHSSLNTVEESRFSGVTAGLGIITHGFRFDYSYGTFGLLGSTFCLGISGSF